MTATQTKNEQILQARIAAFNQINGARVGDYLKLPYGLITRFTHAWDDTIQAGGYAGSAYYLGNGYISYSGGLNSGAKKCDIIPTEETKQGQVWFFDGDISGAHRGVDFVMDFRVFELREGADLTGFPEIKEYEKQQIRNRAETVTMINGNGQEYTQPLPEVYINSFINDVALAGIEEETGLKFTKAMSGYITQPMTHKQLCTLIISNNFKSTYYNNCTFKNMLFLEFNHK